MSIRVAVFDDNAKRREGLQLLIDSTDNMTCVGAWPDCREVVRRVMETTPDVVLMDIDMPHVDGIEGVTLIRKQFKDVKILMQTVLEDNARIFSSILAGADGFFGRQALADLSAEQLVEQ